MDANGETQSRGHRPKEETNQQQLTATADSAH